MVESCVLSKDELLTPNIDEVISNLNFEKEGPKYEQSAKIGPLDYSNPGYVCSPTYANIIRETMCDRDNLILANIIVRLSSSYGG